MDSHKKIFVLDTNVLMHDPTSIFQFHEHDIHLPLAVLEELDNSKKGMSEVARNVRQVSRFLNDIMDKKDNGSINEGFILEQVSMYTPNGEEIAPGRLFFQNHNITAKLPDEIPLGKADNQIISMARELQEIHPNRKVTIVSKDINLRLKAKILGIHSEDYFNDQVLDDVDLLSPGEIKLDDNFWETHSKDMESWQEEGRTFYKITGDKISTWRPNEFIFLEGDERFEAIVRKLDNDHAIIETVNDFQESNKTVWGIKAKNRQQNFALNLLMDPEIDFVSLLGMAGTGKTLLTLAAGLTQVLDEQIYNEIIMTRVTIPVGEDIGFLPGTEEEKMNPWMGALIDNLEFLTQNDEHTDEWSRAATSDLLQNRIKVKSLNFMRGRTFLNKFIIIDEAQNLTSKQMKTLVTRAGPGSKIVCLGNVAQIDTPYLTETTSGLTYIVDSFKNWEYSGHITLRRGERSRLADYASEVLT
ncbi:MAG: PhoH family protein [Gammaproteobacteria bacterium]|nr:MAG: PhoH family protein [Gammaproteobacteria bacterium]